MRCLDCYLVENATQFLGGLGADYSATAAGGGGGQDYSAGVEPAAAGKDYGGADLAAVNETASVAKGNRTDHDEDRIVNGYSVDGRPWYVALQVGFSQWTVEKFFN